MATVILKNVDKVYGRGKEVLKGLDLEFHDREFVVLVGPSGCGKSTILRIVAGLEEATRGEVWIGERMVNDVAPKDRDIAMVFQSYALYPHMTAYDNIAFGLRIRRVPKEELDKAVREAAEMLGVEPLLEKLPKQLSGGERQRIALGRAIVRQPQVFLFDEPLSNLDAKLRTEMRAEISALHRRLQVTTIYVTHDQVEAMTMGQRIVVLREGIVQQVGEPLAIYQQPVNLFVAGFIGSPRMNFFDAQVPEGTDGQLVAAGAKFVLPEEARDLLMGYRGKRVILGLRPEHVDLSPEGEVTARANLVEQTGGDSYVYAQVEGAPLVSRAGGAVRLEIGDQVRFCLNLTQAHFFDPQTEERIRP
ncbi:MAG: sn-glycerol-3-phosphate ABC transporter ATP-binding protein UgpC [Candidatus Eisenbacteria sp.]|nr:sn-glycerol-3-phosphate ABC transporter ATP-binding protein UgpC [Candidatus Eisenbacteria bacterium]